MKKKNYLFGCLVGSLKEFSQIKGIIQYKNHQWLFADPLNAFEAYFKFHFALYLRFSPLNGRFFVIVQRAIFNFKQEVMDKEFLSPATIDTISQIINYHS